MDSKLAKCLKYLGHYFSVPKPLEHLSENVLWLYVHPYEFLNTINEKHDWYLFISTLSMLLKRMNEYATDVHRNLYTF